MTADGCEALWATLADSLGVAGGLAKRPHLYCSSHTQQTNIIIETGTTSCPRQTGRFWFCQESRSANTETRKCVCQPRPACCGRPRPRTTRRDIFHLRDCGSGGARSPTKCESHTACTTRSVRRPVSIARRSPVRAAARSRPVQLGLCLLVRGVGRGGALLHVEGLVGLVDTCAIVSRARAQLIG